jgi:hypothetical protein
MKTCTLLFSLFVVTKCCAQYNYINEFELSTPGTYTSATAVSGWTVESNINSGACTYTNWTQGSPEFSLVATPLVNWPHSSAPTTGYLVHSPLGGTVIAVLNDTSSNNNITRFRKTIAVTQTTTLMQYAYAGLWQNGGSGHGCCDQPGFQFTIYDCNGNTTACNSITLSPNCTSSNLTYTAVQGTADIWTNWQYKAVDLSAYTGSCITIEFTSKDCSCGSHYGTTFLDVSFGLPPELWFCDCVVTPQNSFSVNYCSSSNYANITAPPGFYSYQWISPVTGTIIPGANSNTLSITNPTAGATYTMIAGTVNGCSATSTFMLAYSQVHIGGYGTTPACPGGSNGSATVAAIGSANGYTYTWLNSGNSAISNASIVSGLSPGTYTVIVGANGASCGVDTIAVTIGTTAITKQSIFTGYCQGGSGYLNAGTAGSSYKWYNNGTLISGATSPSYTVASPCNACKYQLAFNNSGCRDSIEYTLVTMQSGTVSVPSASIKPICVAATNGTASVVITKAPGSPVGFNSYYIVSTGTTASYSSTLIGSGTNTFNVSGLSGGTYSVNVFDGSCYYSTTFAVNPFIWNYSLSPTSATLCPGNAIPAGASFSSFPSQNQYTYSWTPTTWLVGGNGNVMQTLITPSGVPSGSIATNIYTVVVTPSLAPCPVTKTMSITFANPAPPVIGMISPFCTSQNTIPVSVSPATGTFVNSAQTPNLVSSNGILNPANAIPGLNSFTFATSVHTCVSTSTSSFQASTFYSAQLEQNTLSLCANGSATLLSTLAQNTVNETWTGPGVQSNSVLPSSLFPGTYTLTHATTSSPDPTLCPDNAQLQVNVEALPVISATSGSICSGNSFTMVANGAPTFSYSSGNKVVSPLASTSYSVWGLNQLGCKSANAAIVFVTVVPTPSVTIFSSNNLPCAGEQVTLTATGASNYTWTSGPDTLTYVVSPAYPTMYKVLGSKEGCEATGFYLQNVLECTGLIEGNRIQIKIYPNPSSGIIRVEIQGNPTSVSAKIKNTLGQVIFATELPLNGTLDLSHFSSGVYFIDVAGESRVLGKFPIVITDH